MAFPIAAAIGALIGGGLLTDRANERAERRARDAALIRDVENRARRFNAIRAHRNRQREANVSMRNAQMQGLRDEDRANRAAADLVREQVKDLRGEEAMKRIAEHQANREAGAGEAVAEATAQGLRGTQSGVEGNVSTALGERAAANQAANDAAAQELARIFGGIEGTRANALDENIALTDLSTDVGLLYRQGQNARRQANQRAQILSQVEPFFEPYQDNSPIEVKANTGLGDLLQLAGTVGLGMAGGTPGQLASGFTARSGRIWPG